MRPIMIQGTSSDAGKTTLVAGLCRLFANRGYRVTPFKSQNMALNSFVTESGGEIARATAIQAAGARQEPNVHMNPLLLKPKADDTAQLIVHGKAKMDVSARAYFLSGELQAMKLAAIRESIAFLRERYDLIIAEGAGSCAEPNLRALDVVNMGLAHELGAKVYVVADIDRGGVFAEILGSLEVMRLTEPRDVGLVAGFILNKFRGDPDVLEPALDFTRKHAQRPVVGVIPYIADLSLHEEDRIRERRCPNPEVDIAVVYLPHISNASDLDFLADEPSVQVRYVKSGDALGVPDAIVIPGTKTTTSDLDYLRRTGFEQAIRDAAERAFVVGICGGYQMLGRTLHDPDRVESPLGTMPGMGLLDFDVEFVAEKTVARRSYRATPENPLGDTGPLAGYEIHCGEIRRGTAPPAFVHEGGVDGAVHPTRPIFGTAIHDVFKNKRLTRAFVDVLRRAKGLPPQLGPLPERADREDESYERLASILERTCADARFLAAH